MLSSKNKNYNINRNTTKCHSNNNNKRLVSSSSLSSSSSTSSTSSSSFPATLFFSPSFSTQKPTTATTNTTKTMEEVWKDINLSNHHDSLSSNVHHRHSNSTNFRNHGGIILQDFLARPFNIDPPTRVAAAAEISLFGSPEVAAAPPPSAPILNLNSGPDGLHVETPNIFNVSTSFNGPFDAIATPSGFLPSFGKKRLPESDDNCGGGDRRHKRMIKNRESAARSRARKQAYTSELEIEVAHLTQENARLKRQQEQLCIAAAAAAQLPKKHTLHRTSTAPF